MLITKDGYAALNFEHSWGDGVAILRYFQDMLKDSSENPRIHPDTKPSNCRPESLVRKLGKYSVSYYRWAKHVFLESGCTNFVFTFSI